MNLRAPFLCVLLLASFAFARPAPKGKRPAPTPPTPPAKTVERKTTDKPDPQAKLQGRTKPTLSSEQQANVDKLHGDLSAMKAKSEVTPAQKQAVQNDIRKILESGATKPSKESVQKLSTDLADAAADGKLTPKEVQKLTDDVAAVLNSANISQADAQQLMTDVQTLLKATNLSKQDAQTIWNDVSAVVKTAQANAAAKKN